jgi:hypothetical protein
LGCQREREGSGLSYTLMSIINKTVWM